MNALADLWTIGAACTLVIVPFWLTELAAETLYLKVAKVAKKRNRNKE